jgi:hypothetical protein
MKNLKKFYSIAQLNPLTLINYYVFLMKPKNNLLLKNYKKLLSLIMLVSSITCYVKTFNTYFKT